MPASFTKTTTQTKPNQRANNQMSLMLEGNEGGEKLVKAKDGRMLHSRLQFMRPVNHLA
jgi:hypothetical protein